MQNYTPEQKNDRLRILEIIYEAHASHIGSCLSVVDIISAIYNAKRPEDKFVLSAGHSAVALYAVLERHNILKDPSLNRYGVHPDRNPEEGIDVSTGSLGQGLPIAVGMALVDRTRNVYCVTSDGELAEGSMWEALRIASDKNLINLKIVVNANGYGAYDPVDLGRLESRLTAFGGDVSVVDGHNVEGLGTFIKREVPRGPSITIARTTVEQFPFLKGQDAHYYTMTDADFVLVNLTLRNQSK